jgi:hypothetical protein
MKCDALMLIMTLLNKKEQAALLPLIKGYRFRPIITAKMISKKNTKPIASKSFDIFPRVLYDELKNLQFLPNTHINDGMVV